MPRRLGILLFTLFQAFWLNVLLPGHVRGQIVMPGTPSAQAGEMPHSCCEADPGPPPLGHDKSDTPSKNRVANCALCAFAAHMTIPPFLDLTFRPTDLLCLLPEPRTQSVTTLELVLSYLGRGPPPAA